MKIAIIGAGIGGLALALALRERGIDAMLYEQASELAEIGAAIALSANATRELRRFGLMEGLLDAATEPSELIYRDGLSGERLAAHPMRLGNSYQARFGAPYLGIHRADLQKVMGDAVGTDNIALGHRLTRIEEQGDGIELHFAGRAPVSADIVIGADGVRSMIREYVTGGHIPARAPIVGSCRSTACRRFPIRRRSSSGSVRMPTCCITRSVVMAVR
jgi:salicylate hydroxylase